VFDYNPPKANEPVDYTGLKIVAILAPVFFLITFLADANKGLTACIILGMIMLAVKVRWNLRKHLWFWAIIAFVLALQVPLVFVVRWPQTNVPTIAYSLPLGIVDFLVVIGAISLGQRVFSVGSFSEEDH
jgi:hypothetical protein